MSVAKVFVGLLLAFLMTMFVGSYYGDDARAARRAAEYAKTHPTQSTSTLSPSEIREECLARSEWARMGAKDSRASWHLPPAMQLDKSEQQERIHRQHGAEAAIAYGMGWTFVREGLSDDGSAMSVYNYCFDRNGEPLG